MVKWGNYTTIENEQKAEEIMEKLTSETYKDLPKDEKIRLANELEEYDRNIKINYIIDRNNDANLIIQDILDEIETVTAQDFEDRLLVNENIYNSALEHASTPEFIKYTEENTKKQYSSFYNYILYDRIEEIMRALFLWNELTLDIEPIPPRGFENVIGKMGNIKVSNFYAIYEYLDAKIHDKYNRLYPEQEEPEDLLISQLPQLFKSRELAQYINYPLDKLSYLLFKTLGQEEDGQLTFLADTQSTNTKKRNELEIGIICSIKWNDQNTKITKQLTEFDKRIYTVLASAFECGIKTLTLNEIHKLMGNSTTASKVQLDKINNSITKLSSARIYINNKTEIEAGYKYPVLDFDTQLLEFDRVTVNKKTTYIHISKRPILIKIANERKQIDTISPEVFKSPISKTEDNLLLDDYLIVRILHMKNPKNPRKILFNTLCKECHINTKQKKQRLPEKLIKFLGQYKKAGLIVDYEMDSKTKDITIIL